MTKTRHIKGGAWTSAPEYGDATTAALLQRTDLIYGSEVGAWRTDGGNAVSNSTVIARITEAKIPLIRWAVRDTFTDRTHSSLGQTGTQSRTDFDTAINGFINTLGAVPMIKLPPITKEALGSPSGPASTTRNVTVTTTSGSTTVTATPGTFNPRDALGFITGTGIPAGARIEPYVSSSQVGIATRVGTTTTYTTATATASGTVTAAVGQDSSWVAAATFAPVYGSDTTLAQNLDTYKAIIAQAGPRVRIYESNNEMEYTASRYWQSQGAPFTSAGSVGVSTMLGKHYAATMPALKKYARGLGFEIIGMGYAGISGGTGWGNTIASPNTRTFTEFNTAAHDAYVAAKGDPDYIPDAVSVHAYPHSGDFTMNSTSTDDIITYWDNWAAAQRTVLTSIWGATIGSRIKLSVSEWNAGFTNDGGAGWTGFTTTGGDDVAYFYDQWLRMLRRNGFWHASCFALASNGPQNYDMITETGATRPQYAPFKALSSVNA